LFLSLPACTQPASAPIVSAARHVIEDDEALDPRALDNQVKVGLRSRRRLGRIVNPDRAAKHDTPSHCEPRQRRVEDVAADFVEEDVDFFGAQLL
jgi:hypothetical protein